MQVKKQQLEQDMEQQTGSKLGKEYVKAIYCHPAYLTCMQNTSCEMPDWMKHKLVSRLLGEISITSDMQMTPLSWQKARETKEPLDESERGEWKKLAWNSTLEKLSSWHLCHYFMANKRGKSRNSERFYFLGLPNHCRWWLQPWN